ncbi:Hypothetical predicted protein [Olea europaea subsp. europaea]|uniref:Uncharacterized protein n=1 Tax=Olea europaea subsp. europaea TaxID=158383 RepID=A0A8S0TD47_OLEEU|nr:Hypothetical predicted protein [Olea europaea subsp. europaea]
MSGHGVQAMFGTQADFQAHEGSTVSGHVRDTGTFPSISGLLLGHDVQAMSRTHPGYGTQLNFQAFLGNLRAWCRGHVQGAAQLSGISRQFLGHDVQAMLEKRPGHGRAVCGHSMQAMSRTYPSRVSGTRSACSVRDASRPWKGCILVSRQFLGHDVQAIFGTRRAAAGMQPDFSTFLGNF